MVDLATLAQINVLIVVDVEGALSSGDLGNNVYLIDTAKHFGSGREGQQELQTACRDGQVIIWSVTPVNPGTDVEISAFTGQMVEQSVCKPVQTKLPSGDVVWSARVETRGDAGTYQYSCELTFDGKPMSFDPFLNVVAG